MVLFGVPRLDEVLDDDRVATSVLLLSEPAVEAEPFLHQAARLRLEGGGSVVYVVTDRSPTRVRESLAHQGLRDASRLHFVDAFSALLGIHDGQTPTLPKADDVEGLVRMLGEAARDHADALLVIDSLSGLALRAQERFDAAAKALWDAVGRFSCCVALYTQWGDDGTGHPLLERFLDQVRLTGVRHRITTNQYFRVRSVGGVPCADQDAVLFRTDEDGVHVYIPKIVVTGPQDAGKTTFIHTVCDRAVSTERKGTTVALDRGQIRRHGLQVEVFGTPGQERFQPMIAPLLRQAVGVVLMVDAAHPEDFDRAKALLQQVWDGGHHAIVAANKQDLDDALSPMEVARRLGLPPSVPVVGCHAEDRGSAESVLSVLIDRVLHSAEVVA